MRVIVANETSLCRHSALPAAVAFWHTVAYVAWGAPTTMRISPGLQYSTVHCLLLASVRVVALTHRLCRACDVFIFGEDA
jgi:hypothetical protein